MKSFFVLLFLSPSIFAATSTIKFVASTNGPGISVEGEAKNTNLKIDFNKLENTSVIVDVMDLSTGMEKRDKHLHEKVFNTTTAGVAKIEYTLTKINCPKDGNEVECDCIGNLKIKDVQNEIKFKAKLNRSNQMVEGKTLVSLNQFKLNSPSFMGISVEDNVEVEFRASGKN